MERPGNFIHLGFGRVGRYHEQPPGAFGVDAIRQHVILVNHLAN